MPPVNTQAAGNVEFQLSSDGKEINYDLTTTNLNGFMMAHIHKGKSGEDGPPVVAALQMGKGKITSSDLQWPLAGKQISDLADLMKNGQAYANVHTEQNQNSEIRGQIMSGWGKRSPTSSGTYRRRKRINSIMMKIKIS